MGLLPGHDWTIPLCRGVGGIEHNIVFEGASVQGKVSWVAQVVTSRGAIPRTSPGPKLCLNVSSINHSTIKNARQCCKGVGTPRSLLGCRSPLPAL